MWLAGAMRDSASIDCFQFFLCLSRASSSNTQPSPHAVSPGHMHLYSHICPHRVFMVLPKPGRKEGHSWAHFLIQEIPTECSLRCQKDARQREFKPPSRSLSMGNCLPLGRKRPKERPVGVLRKAGIGAWPTVGSGMVVSTPQVGSHSLNKDWGPRLGETGSRVTMLEFL